MRSEVDIFGIYLPSAFPIAIGAFLLLGLLRRALATGGIYRFIANKSLFDTAMYICLFSFLVLAASRVPS
jgi:hypothetical protein